MRNLVWFLLLILAVAHQDFWWRADHKTLVFGFLPVSMAYHIGISIAAGILWGLACKFCWPTNLEVPDEEAWVAPTGKRGGH